MAGRPRRHAILTALEARTREHFEVPDGEPCSYTPVDYAVAWIENGETLRRLADEVSIEVGFRVWQGSLVTQILETGGSDQVTMNERRIKNARVRGGHAVVEDAQAIVDAPAMDQVEVSRAASRARVRLWTAERWNREELGKSPDVSIAITAGSLHLEALMARRDRPANRAALPSGAPDNVEDAQVVHEPDVVSDGTSTTCE